MLKLIGLWICCVIVTYLFLYLTNVMLHIPQNGRHLLISAFCGGTGGFIGGSIKLGWYQL